MFTTIKDISTADVNKVIIFFPKRSPKFSQYVAVLRLHHQLKNREVSLVPVDYDHEQQKVIFDDSKLPANNIDDKTKNIVLFHSDDHSDYFSGDAEEILTPDALIDFIEAKRKPNCYKVILKMIACKAAYNAKSESYYGSLAHQASIAATKKGLFSIIAAYMQKVVNNEEGLTDLDILNLKLEELTDADIKRIHDLAAVITITPVQTNNHQQDGFEKKAEHFFNAAKSCLAEYERNYFEIRGPNTKVVLFSAANNFIAYYPHGDPMQNIPDGFPGEQRKIDENRFNSIGNQSGITTFSGCFDKKMQSAVQADLDFMRDYKMEQKQQLLSMQDDDCKSVAGGSSSRSILPKSVPLQLPDACTEHGDTSSVAALLQVGSSLSASQDNKKTGKDTRCCTGIIPQCIIS